jgi:hypothetical protein
VDIGYDDAMRLATLLLALALFVPGLVRADEAFKEIHVSDLVALQHAKPKVHVYDANTEEFRAKNGVIPGAAMLSSFDKYDVAKELPADKNAPLVFYCTSRL